MVPPRIEHALRRLRWEYLAAPDLLLTPSQASGLIEMERETARVLLDALEFSRFLERTPDGRYALAGGLRRTARGTGALVTESRQMS